VLRGIPEELRRERADSVLYDLTPDKDICQVQNIFYKRYISDIIDIEYRERSAL
jgi:hypothetical protein